MSIGKKIICVVVCVLISYTGSHSEELKNIDMYSDEQIEAAMAKNHILKITKKGSLLELSKSNRLKIEKNEWQSIDEVIEEIGLKYDKLVAIEGIGVNGWCIERYQASKNYDLFIEFHVKNPNKEPKIFLKSIFFTPHQNRKYDKELFSERLWGNIIVGSE